MKKNAGRVGNTLRPLVRCVHYWSYPHAIWQGRKPAEVTVARYCSKCGKKQMAYAHKWQNIPASYPDVREACTPNAPAEARRSRSLQPDVRREDSDARQ